jgi:HIV Tat-specific factor 1
VAQASANAKLLPDTFYLYNGAFYTFDFANNKWTPAATSVYAYVDYMTGIGYKWDEKENKWASTSGGGSTLSDEAAATNEVGKQQQTTPAPAATTATVPGAKDVKSEKKKKEGWVNVDDEKNTNVYVSGLPLDITDDEFEEMMSKYGIIMKDPVNFKLKIKLYRDEANEAKGDGRCCYLMVSKSIHSIWFRTYKQLI